jgi:hypothetical protein
VFRRCFGTQNADVSGRWHDTRHTLATELTESEASGQTIMDIAAHVSRQMLSRYSHIRMEAKRAALEYHVNTPELAPKAWQPSAEQDSVCPTVLALQVVQLRNGTVPDWESSNQGGHAP